MDNTTNQPQNPTSQQGPTPPQVPPVPPVMPVEQVPSAPVAPMLSVAVSSQQVAPSQNMPPTQPQPLVTPEPAVSATNPVSAPVSAPPVDVPPVPPVTENTADTARRDIPQLDTTPAQVKPVTQETVASLPTTPPPPPEKAKDSFPEDTHHSLLPKPLLITLGVLVFFAIVLLGVNVLKGMINTGGGSGKVTLTYWGLWESPAVMQPIINDFEKQHPNITINYSQEDPNQYDQRLQVRSQQGNGPDIFRYNVTWLPMLSQFLAPLPVDTIAKTDLEKNYYPFVTTDLVKNGALFGVPLGMDTLALYVNNALFKTAQAQVPTTWNDFITVARALTQKDSNGKIQVAGAAIGTFDNVTHAPDILSLLFLQNGVNLSTMSPAQNASDALTFYTSFASDTNSVWDNSLPNSQLAFAQGKVALYFGYSYDMFAIHATNPNLDYSVYPVPHLPGRSNTVTNYWVEGVSAKSTHQQAALLFMKYLAQKDTLTKLYTEEAKTRSFGELYPRSDLASTFKDNALLYPFVQQAPNAASSFFAADTFDTTGINSHMNQYLGNAVRSVLGNTSADTAVQTLSQGVAQVLSQYGQQ